MEQYWFWILLMGRFYMNLRRIRNGKCLFIFYTQQIKNSKFSNQVSVKSVYPVDDYLITASSDGSVCIWDKDWNLVIEHNIPEGNRITCMVAMLADSNSEPKNVEDEAAKRQSLDSETSETSSESESESEYYSTSKQPPVKRTKHA